MRADDLHVAEVVTWGNGKGVPAKAAPVDRSRWSTFDSDRAATTCWPDSSSAPTAACCC